MSRTFFLVIVAALALCWGRAAARSGAGARVLPGLAEAGLGWLRRHSALPDPSRIDRRSTTGFGTKRRVVEESGVLVECAGHRLLQGLKRGIQIVQAPTLHGGRAPLHPGCRLVVVFGIPGRHPVVLDRGPLDLDADLLQC